MGYTTPWGLLVAKLGCGWGRLSLGTRTKQWGGCRSCWVGSGPFLPLHFCSACTQHRVQAGWDVQRQLPASESHPGSGQPNRVRSAAETTKSSSNLPPPFARPQLRKHQGSSGVSHSIQFQANVFCKANCKYSPAPFPLTQDRCGGQGSAGFPHISGMRMGLGLGSGLAAPVQQ